MYNDKLYQSVYRDEAIKHLDKTENPTLDLYGSSTTQIMNTDLNIFIVGLGGTGSYFIRDFSRFLYSFYSRIEENKKRIKVTLIDGDIVEDKNLLRQNFLKNDLGKNKAEVMARRHNRVFNIDLQYYPHFLDENTKVIRTDSSMTTLVIGCVDNNKARRIISDLMHRSSNRFLWLDAGNERKSGQVILGGYPYRSRYGYNSNDRNKIPCVTDLYPEILDSESDSQDTISCAERMLEDEQNMFVNIQAASNLLLLTKKVILSEELNTHGIEFSIDGGTNTRHLLTEGTV